MGKRTGKMDRVVLCMFNDMIITARILRHEENPNSKEYDESVAKPKKKKGLREKK